MKYRVKHPARGSGWFREYCAQHDIPYRRNGIWTSILEHYDYEIECSPEDMVAIILTFPELEQC
jgi:hypothetical protein